MKKAALIYASITSGLFTLLVIFAVIVYARGNFVTSAESKKERISVLASLGKKLPSITLNDIEGNSFPLDSVVKKTSYIGFSATWCVPCKWEYPNLDRLAKDQNRFDIINISIDFDKEKWKSKYEKRNYRQFIINSEEDFVKLKDFLDRKEFSIPYYIFADENGVVLTADALRSEAVKIYFFGDTTAAE